MNRLLHQYLKRHWFALVFAALLTGCAAELVQGQRNALIRQGQPPAYVDGYGEGYESGTHAAGNPYFKFRKDVRRFESDSLYQQGWKDGFEVGKAKYESAARSLR